MRSQCDKGFRSSFSFDVLDVLCATENKISEILPALISQKKRHNYDPEDENYSFHANFLSLFMGINKR